MRQSPKGGDLRVRDKETKVERGQGYQQIQSEKYRPRGHRKRQWLRKFAEPVAGLLQRNKIQRGSGQEQE